MAMKTMPPTTPPAMAAIGTTVFLTVLSKVSLAELLDEPPGNPVAAALPDVGALSPDPWVTEMSCQ